MPPSTCPPWCGRPPGHPDHHEVVVGQYGGTTSPAATVTVEAHDDGFTSLAARWHTTNGDTGHLWLTPADAVTLARILTAVPVENVVQLAYALTSAAVLLGHQVGEVPR